MNDIQFTDSQKELFKHHNSSCHGLSSAEARERLLKYGKNVLVEKKRKLFILTFLGKFTNPLVMILLFASLLSAFTGELLNFGIIFFIILMSITIETYQEHQSETAAKRLKQRVAVKATVLRDNKKEEIPPSQLTLGDCIFLALGDVVPADLKIIWSKDLHVDESTLNGESFPVQKDEGDEVLTGSTVMNGEALGVIIRLIKDTEFGKIAENLNLRRPMTDFEKGIKQFGYLVLRITFFLVLAILGINIIFKHDILDSFLFALALAVGLTPELLPMIVTVNLSKGALRMAKKGVIVKHLPAIQNFGGMDVLCSDKTGTLTQNKIVLERYENIHAVDDKHVLIYAYINSHFQSSIKNPMDDAVLAHTEVSQHGYAKVDEIPFDFIRKRLSIIVKRGDEHLLICKGAPESVSHMLTHYDDNHITHAITPERKKQIQDRFEELSQQGFRVLTIAYKKVHAKKTYSKEDEKDLVFLGLIAFLDPPKHDVKEILQTLFSEGVQLKILTGDNELVTKHICTELHIPVTGVVLGKDLAHVTDIALIPLVTKASIFARLDPLAKARVITALKKSGHAVGYLGDGVNDAPALRAADIGISVDNAVDVAKEAADIILLSKSLKVLKDGIYEGRKTFANTMKYIFMGMGSNFGNMVSVSIASIFLPFLPLLPIQILLNNLLYDLSQLSLATDTVDPEDVSQPVRWHIDSIKKFMFTFGPISSLFDFITFAVLLYVFQASIPFFRTGWFVESIVTQSLIILVIRTRKVPFFKSKPSPLLLATALGGALVGIIIAQSPVGSYFEFVGLPAVFWIFIGSIVVYYFMLTDVVKWFFYKKS